MRKEKKFCCHDICSEKRADFEDFDLNPSVLPSAFSVYCNVVLQCVAVRCGVLQCVAMRFSVFQCVAVIISPFSSTLGILGASLAVMVMIAFESSLVPLMKGLCSSDSNFRFYVEMILFFGRKNMLNKKSSQHKISFTS